MGNEYIFPNIDDALKYVLENEQKALALDRKRQVAPWIILIVDISIMHHQKVLLCRD